MTSSFRTVHNRCADAARAGFSLIELLVVIVIIAIVIGITVPAIGGARDLARASSTQATLAGLGNAISSFRADEQRLPGYFNTRQMGRADTGLSGMQNIMLDLAGGPAAEASANTLTIGPVDGDPGVEVNLALIGEESNSGANYFNPGDDWTVAEGKTAAGDAAAMPELVDAWGTPVLAWAEDEFAPTVPDEDAEIADFAAIDSETDPARFYWRQNAGSLSSTGLGPRNTSQQESLLFAGEANIPASLAALLGSVADPINPDGELADATVSDLVPGSARGGVVLHSAGRDRVYLSTEDDGFADVTGQFVYGSNFSPDLASMFGDAPWSSADEQEGTRDVVSGFNDLITAVGG